MIPLTWSMFMARAKVSRNLEKLENMVEENWTGGAWGYEEFTYLYRTV